MMKTLFERQFVAPFDKYNTSYFQNGESRERIEPFDKRKRSVRWLCFLILGIATTVALSSTTFGLVQSVGPDTGISTWEFGTSGIEKMVDVAVDGQGNMYTLAQFGGTIDADPGTGEFLLTAGSSNYFLVKLDHAGEFLWALLVPGSITTDLAVNPVNEDVYISGSFSVATDFDPGGGTTFIAPTGITDGFVLRLDAMGAFVWVKTEGTANVSTYYNAVAYQDDLENRLDMVTAPALIFSDGLVAVAGFTHLSGTPQTGVVGLTDNSALTPITQTGIPIFAGKNVIAKDVEILYDPVLEQFAGLGVIGTRVPFDDVIFLGSQVGFVAYVDGLGGVYDVTTISAPGADHQPTGLDVDAAGNFYVSTNRFTTLEQNPATALVHGYDTILYTSIDLAWEVAIGGGGGGTTTANDVVVDDYGNVYFTGGTNGDVVFPNNQVVSTIVETGYITKLLAIDGTFSTLKGRNEGLVKVADEAPPRSLGLAIAFDASEKFLSVNETSLPEDDGAGIYVGLDTLRGTSDANDIALYRRSIRSVAFAEFSATELILTQVDSAPDLDDLDGDLFEDLTISDGDGLLEMFDVRLAKVVEFCGDFGSVDEMLTIDLVGVLTAPEFGNFSPVKRMEFNGLPGSDVLRVMGDETQTVIHYADLNFIADIVVERGNAPNNLFINHTNVENLEFDSLGTLSSIFAWGDNDLHLDPAPGGEVLLSGTSGPPFNQQPVIPATISDIEEYVLDAVGEILPNGIGGGEGSSFIALHDNAFGGAFVDAFNVLMGSHDDQFTLDSELIGPFGPSPGLLQPGPFHVDFGFNDALGDKFEITADADFNLNYARLLDGPDIGHLFVTGEEHTDYFGGPSNNEFVAGGYVKPLELHGGAGNDKLSGGQSGDKIFGDAGNDELFGGRGADELWGGTGDDLLNGDIGNDDLFGESGSDVFRYIANATNDSVTASFSIAGLVITGPKGTDRLGYDSTDMIDINARAGNDTITIDAGVPLGGFINGGKGFDTCVINNGMSWTVVSCEN